MHEKMRNLFPAKSPLDKVFSRPFHSKTSLPGTSIQKHSISKTGLRSPLHGGIHFPRGLPFEAIIFIAAINGSELS